MFLKQYYLGCLAHASYMIGDEVTKRAVVVDPQRDTDHYLKEADDLGFKITDVILTHIHADFVAGHLELREVCDATIWLGKGSPAEYKYEPAEESRSITFGDVKIEFLETPGHTPNAVCVVVYDMSKNADAPHAVLTGDTLFIGDVGRPDLFSSTGNSSAELAGMLYDSLHNKLLQLPDETLVYPAHGAGSMCGKNLSKDTCSTIGVQKKTNYACGAMDKMDFISLVTADLPLLPGYFAYDATMNQKEHETLSNRLKNLRGLSKEEFLDLQKGGAQVLDTRNANDYAAEHLLESINVGLSGQFATWCGTILDSHRPILLICEPGTEIESAMRLGRIGFDQVKGYLQDGMKALGGHDRVQKLGRLSPQQVQEHLDGPAPPLVLDVRNPVEFSQKRIPGSMHIPLSELRKRCHEIPQGRQIVVHCAGGYRSAIALGILQAAGHCKAIDMTGGIGQWEAAGLTVEKGAEKVCESTAK
jgi:glyoxylase-like metal-dependent hydrolase (beta-lactamase superfamily II)/rhodanese-related sulfurtransferase